MIALLALVVPTWVPIALALALLGGVLADGWTVRAAPTIERRASTALSRGARTPLRITVGAQDGRRVLLRQPPAAGVAVDGGTAVSELSGGLTALVRGRHVLPGVASASLGPLGLTRVHHPSGEPTELRVYPDVAGARRLILRLRRAMAGHRAGWPAGRLGLGTEFEAVRDYSVDDDIRAINWRATARMGRPMSNQYRVERDREVVSLIDCGRLMGASLGAGTLLDTALDAVTVIALAVDELGDRFGAIAFDDGVRRAVTPGISAAMPPSSTCLISRPGRWTPTSSVPSPGSDARAAPSCSSTPTSSTSSRPARCCRAWPRSSADTRS